MAMATFTHDCLHEKFLFSFFPVVARSAVGLNGLGLWYLGVLRALG